MEFRLLILGSMLTDTTSPHLALNPLCRVALGSVSNGSTFPRQFHSDRDIPVFSSIVLSSLYPIPRHTELLQGYLALI